MNPGGEPLAPFPGEHERRFDVELLGERRFGEPELLSERANLRWFHGVPSVASGLEESEELFATECVKGGQRPRICRRAMEAG